MKILLRAVEEEDLKWLLKYRNEPSINMNFNQPTPLSYEEQLNWYKDQVLTKKTFAYIMTLNQVNIGYVAIQNINWITRSAEISHFIVDCFDQSLFCQVAHLIMLQTAFRSLNLHRIHSICFEFNKVIEELKKIGFKIEGVIRDHCFKDGKYFNSYLISILKEDYESLYP